MGKILEKKCDNNCRWFEGDNDVCEKHLKPSSETLEKKWKKLQKKLNNCNSTEELNKVLKRFISFARSIPESNPYMLDYMKETDNVQRKCVELCGTGSWDKTTQRRNNRYYVIIA